MKKLLIVAMSIVLCLFLFSCDGSTPNDETADLTKDNVTTKAPDTETENNNTTAESEDGTTEDDVTTETEETTDFTIDNTETTAPTVEHEHAWGNWVTVKYATCIEEGLQQRVCPCGEKEEQKVAVAEHTIVKDEAVEPTCLKTGLTEGYHCSVCEKITVAQETIQVKPHTEVKIEAKAATCTATGLTEGKKCSACETITLSQEIVPAIAHSWGSWTVVDDEDKTLRNCQNCDAQQEITDIRAAYNGIRLII